MAQSRYINTRFWKDNYIVELNPSDKLLFLYLITNQNTNIAGIYEISLREICMDTGFNEDMVKSMLEKFRSDGKAFYIEGHIVVRNFINHQAESPKIQAGIAKIIETLPDRLRKFIILNDRGLWIDSGELKGDLQLLSSRINAMWLTKMKKDQDMLKKQRELSRKSKGL